jgi:hypothetical protein
MAAIGRLQITHFIRPERAPDRRHGCDRRGEAIGYAAAIERRSIVQDMGDNCPFAFNFDASTFKVGDIVSYRVTGSLSDFPFVGTLLEVGEGFVVISADPDDPASRMRGTRESRPVVEETEIA